VVALFLPLFLIAALLPARRKAIVWGSAPLISNKYWSLAMREGGYESLTIMSGVQAYDKREDFDRYFEDFAPRFVPGPLRFALGSCLAFLFVLRRAAMLNTSYFGFVVGYTWWWRLEPLLCRLAGVKTVVIPFGADAFIHARIIDPSLLYGLLASRPEWARIQVGTERRVQFWNRHADAVIAGPMIDGIGRWDVTTNQPLCIDTSSWVAKCDFGENDGINGPVKVLHTPSSRGFKGTEFLLDAVKTLQAEGLNIELMLLEGVPNTEVRKAMCSADILAEQFLAPGYGTNGVEGLASGLPVLANLEHEAYSRVYRRFGFLNECPIVSAAPENLAERLRVLVRNPELRRELGTASRAFAEKYHSYATAQYMFGALYEKLVRGADIDLMTLFHPLLSEYNRRTPWVQHPLMENRLTSEWLSRV
jgi:glycosyltransferase involved in cell wall biosynthesis